MATYGKESAARRVATEKLMGTLTVWIALMSRSRRDFVDLVSGRSNSLFEAAAVGINSSHWECRASRRVIWVRLHAD